ncbi:MAG: hypothetical protein LH609_15290 [Rudanella sp.]|nr:hypothetical protein [Rudanella sp.]
MDKFIERIAANHNSLAIRRLMKKGDALFDFFYDKLLSEKTKKKSEQVIVTIAIVSFIIHLLLIAAVDLGFLQPTDRSKLLSNPIVAIYTPFSFILIYEVYLLVYYLPKSTSNYIGKQYEIITLIVIRRIYSELSKLEFTADWFKVTNDLQFTYDLVATTALFFLIFIFYRLNEKVIEKPKDSLPSLEVKNYTRTKKIIAMCLVPLFLVLAVYSFGHWVYENFFSITRMVDSIKDVNKIFFDEFFTVLILTDVLMLLISFLLTDKFNRVIRNSGFVISTILIKLSFGASGLLNSVLVVVAVLFGVTMLAIYNQYEKLNPETDV